MIAPPSTRTTATAELLWRACRADPDAAQVREALDAGADADLAADTAIDQRAGPLLWRALGLVGRRDALTSAAATLAQEAGLRRAQALTLLPHAVELAIGPLRAAGFEPLVFKGPALLGRYPEPGLRPMDDIDVLLPARQHQEGLRILGRAGWRLVRQRPGQDHHESLLVHAELPALPLELHFALGSWRDRTTSLTSDELWRRRVPGDLLGSPGWGLPPEIELLALANHAGKPFHHYDRLIWATDLAVVIASTAGDGGLDWEAVADGARRWHCRTTLAVGLAQVARLGVETPSGLRTLAVQPTQRTALAPVLSVEWPLVERDDGLRQRLRYALTDNRAQQAVILAGQATTGPWWQAPGRLAGLVGRAGRRWWQLRRNR
ncbi:hypothetical protein BH20ACT2_BH20ACT2_05240 [soil metagenome]